MVAIGICSLLPVVLKADDTCGQPGNLTYNCNFNGFVDRGNGNSTPDGWLPWVAMGSPAFDRDDHGSAPGAPAQRIWSDGGTWTAGLYQQVQVTPGKGYTARIDWAAPGAENIERRIGIDPYGGTDPLAPRVVWSRSEWAVVRMPDLAVSTYAEAATITIFVWTHHPTSSGADEVFLDAVILVDNPSMPLRTPSPTPTVPPPTRRPPTRTPAPVPPTDTPTPLPPTDTPTPEPTETPTLVPPTATPTPTDTPTALPPTDTPTPTQAPTITPVPVAKVVRTPVAGPATQVQRTPRQTRGPEAVFLYVMAVAVVGAALLAVLVLILWLRGRRQASGRD